MLSHLNPCLYCKMNKPDHYSRHCHMKPLFKEYNQDRIWKYDKCFYCHDDPSGHPGRKCPQFGKYWKDMGMSRARSRRAATTASILQNGSVDAADPEPTPSSMPSFVAPSSSSSSSSSGSELPSVLHAHIPIDEIRICRARRSLATDLLLKVL